MNLNIILNKCQKRQENIRKNFKNTRIKGLKMQNSQLNYACGTSISAIQRSAQE